MDMLPWIIVSGIVVSVIVGVMMAVLIKHAD
ncbi:hypothetical protein CZ809_03513 [Photobacterium piscicola]|jgi:hypothetical protein|uniref:Uncharacterized protein n=1 Tax=Photobacterium piscicola TaxID=1378299 RepID=A0A1T5I4M2_9GAMM|nr:hypothetical protein CZ809_03513 [Photobacterium piscicola]